jgi:quercetin dioxygenase-like cupin family protein
MKNALIVLLLCGAAAAQDAASPRSEERKEILRNQHVRVSRVEIRHDRDVLSVFITGGDTMHTVEGEKPVHDKVAAGTARFRNGGFSHARTNQGMDAFRVVVTEFAEPQGKSEPISDKSSHYCNPGSKTACVNEKYLFCTAKVCVEEVSIAPDAITIKHGHPTDHMLIAITDYELTDVAEGKGTSVRNVKSGDVEYIPAGITHQLTNTGKGTARFVVVVFK